jgi:hypothetical protein
MTVLYHCIEFSKRSGVYGDYNRANATVFISCLTTQVYNVTYSLLKKPIFGSEPFQEVKFGHGISQLFIGIYQIDSLSPSQEGYYKCRASLRGVTIEKELDEQVWIS